MPIHLRFQASDSDIIEMVRHGNEHGLEILYRTCRAPVTAYLKRNGGSDDDADDLLQEAVVVAWEQIRTERFRGESSLQTYIVAVVKNLWFRRLAQRKREKPGLLEPDTIADGELSALELLIEDEQTTAVARVMETLGDPCRTLLLLYYYEERSMKQIAEQMGYANADTVKAKKYQCRKILQRRLEALENRVP